MHVNGFWQTSLRTENKILNYLLLELLRPVTHPRLTKTITKAHKTQQKYYKRKNVNKTSSKTH